MTIPDVLKSASEAGVSLTDKVDHFQRNPGEAYDVVRAEAHKLLANATEQIKNNPLPAVVGALAFGAAVGYLIFSNRQRHAAEVIDEPLQRAGGLFSDAFSDLRNNLKFW